MKPLILSRQMACLIMAQLLNRLMFFLFTLSTLWLSVALNAYGQENGLYKIVNAYNGKLLDMAIVAGNPNGAKVHAWSENGQDNQKWRLVAEANGAFKIINAYNQKLLDMAAIQGNPNGAQVYGWEDNRQSNQRWRFVADGGGLYKIVNLYNSKLLDMALIQGNPNGAQVYAWDDNRQSNQRWRLLRIDTPLAPGPEAPDSSEADRRYLKLDLPYVRTQTEKWSCGPNSATRVLQFHGLNVSYEMVMSIAKNKSFIADLELGTTPHALRDTMQVWRKETILKRETELSTIYSALNQGKPVIALIRVGSKPKDIAVMGKDTIVGRILDPIGARPNITATFPLLHWVVIYGYDRATKEFYVQNPNGADERYPAQTFYNKWNWSVGEGAAKEYFQAEGVTTRTILY